MRMIIKEKNKKGSVEYVTAYMIICMTGLLMLFTFSRKELREYEIIARDSLDSACLSAALIDFDYFSQGKQIFISNHSLSHNIFLETLKQNMNLNEDGTPKESSLYDKVTVHEFIIYNIIEGELVSYIYREGGSGPEYRTEAYDRNEKTPNGKPIVSSTIYADIGMNVTSFMGISRYVHISSSVDVVNNEV